MKEDKKYVRYDMALTDNEILQYALIIDQYEKGKIDNQTLRNLFLDKGVTIEPRFHDYSKMLLLSSVGAMKKRILEGNYVYNDVDCFVLNSEGFKNVVFRMDRKAIEVLADYGIPEYQEALLGILSYQLRLVRWTVPKDEKMLAEWEKWRRRVIELEASLAKSDTIDESRENKKGI